MRLQRDASLRRKTAAPSKYAAAPRLVHSSMRGSRSCRTSRSHRGRAWSRGRDGEATPPGPEVARGLRCPPRPCRGGNVASAGLAGRTLCGAVAEAGIVSALPAELMSERDFTAAQASRRAGNRSMDASFMFSEPPRPRVGGRNARSSSGVVTPPSRPHPHARLPREPPAPQAEHERRLRDVVNVWGAGYRLVAAR